jgi:RNA polymerase sigma-70 factor, ECF subfamily
MKSAGPSTWMDSTDRRTRFEYVYTANYQPIHAYALRRTQTRDDAADVVAETFLTAWRRLDDAPTGPVVRLWLFGIARLVLANHLRGQRRYERLGERLRATAVPTDTGLPVGNDGRRHGIATTFGRLRSDDREILMLVAAEGLTPAEIAQVLGCSGVTVRVRLHRARARFARMLAADGIDV